MFRRLLLSTVYRNAPDGAGGAAPKPDDAAAAAPAAPAVDVAAAAPAVADPAPAEPAPAAPAPDAVDPAAAAPEPAPVGDKPADKDFSGETLLTADETKPAAPDAAPKGDDKPAADGAKPDAAAAAKPGEGAAPDGQKPAEAQPAPVVAPVYAYEFPEGLKVDAEALKPINETFAKHGVSPETAKELMGLHVSQMQAYADTVVAQTAQQQRDVWADTRKTWRDEIKSDEQIGGAAYETTLRQAAEVRDRLVPKDQLGAFNRMLLVTGVGDHPEFIRFMKNAHRYVGEPTLTAQGQPTKTNGQPGGRRRIRDTYKTA